MSSSTARRTSIVGLGALGLALVAGPLAAATPATAQVPVPLPTESPLDVLVEAVEPVVEQLPAPVQEPVQQAVQTVQSAVPAPPPVPLPGGAPPAPPAPGGPEPEPTPPVKQGAPAAGAPAGQQPAAAAPAAAAPPTSTPLFSDARTLRAYSAGSGTAVLDAFSAAIGMGSVGGFGTTSALRFPALAPEVAAPLAALPGLEAPEVAPQEIQLAADLGAADGPIPAGLPGMTVAAAALAIASAAAAHLAAASRRRDIFS